MNKAELIVLMITLFVFFFITWQGIARTQEKIDEIKEELKRINNKS